MSNNLINKPGWLNQIIFILCLILCIYEPVQPFFIFPIQPPIALLAGIIIALTIGNPFIKYNKKATTLLLQVSIVCLGFNINLQHALEAGKSGFIFTVSTIAVTLVCGYFIGKMLKIDKTTSFLISNGTAICGGSAIAAVAPIVKANEQQMSMALGTIFILNSIALFIFPSLGHYFGFTDEQFGTWCAIAIHDTSSVVGAAKQYSEKALQIATTIKLERALWIIPISLATAYYQKQKSEEGKVKIKIPYFIFLFLLAIIVSTYFPITYSISGHTPYYYLYTFGRKGLVLTLFLIGSGLSIKTMKSVGWRPVLQGVLLWIIISVSSLLVIKNFV